MESLYTTSACIFCRTLAKWGQQTNLVDDKGTQDNLDSMDSLESMNNMDNTTNVDNKATTTNVDNATNTANAGITANKTNATNKTNKTTTATATNTATKLDAFSGANGEAVEQLLYQKLRDNYFGLYCIDLDTGTAKIIRSAHPELTGPVGFTVRYADLMSSIASASQGETVEFLRKISSTAFLKERFSKDESAFFFYESFIFEGRRWISVTGRVLQRHDDGTPALFAIGFSLMDEEASRKEVVRTEAMRAEFDKLIGDI